MSDDERIRRAADALRRDMILRDKGWELSTEAWQRLAARALDAADHEPPKWPTDESVRRHCSTRGWCAPEGEQFEVERDALRNAMLADPIIEAAVAYRNQINRADAADTGRALIDVVNEAGL